MISYYIRRLIYKSTNLCIDPFIEDLLLYGLAVSRGIRIDTVVYIVKDREVYVVNGYTVRHLYPHRKSLRGFIEKILCRRRAVPGVNIYPVAVLNELFSEKTTIVTQSNGSGKLFVKPMLQRNIIIVDKDSMLYFKYLFREISGEQYTLIENDKSLFISKAHYILDTIIGGWVRRLGEIKYYEGVRRTS